MAERAEPQSPSRVAPPIVNRVLARGGERLTEATHAVSEPRVRADLSRVRIHRDDLAAESAAAVGARAYTVGQNIVFGRGQFHPGTACGDQLLAHELTHTVQQGPRAIPAAIPLGPLDGPHEAAARNGSAVPGDVAPMVQRAPGDEAKAATDPDALADAAIADYEKKSGKTLRPKLRKWAHDYERARVKVPQVPALDSFALYSAEDHFRAFGEVPLLPHPEEAIELPKGAVGANDAFPFPKGSSVLLTQLVSELARKFKSDLLMAAAMFSKSDGKGLAGNAKTILDVLTDPAVAKSISGKVTESSPALFAVTLEVPEIPQYMVTAREVTIELRATNAVPEFDFSIIWPGGRSIFSNIKMSRGADGTVVIAAPITPKTTVNFTSKPTGKGGVTLGVDDPLVPVATGGDDTKLTLMRVDPLADSTAATKTEVAKAATESADYVPSNHSASIGSTLGYGGGQVLPGTQIAWRFTYSLMTNALTLPITATLDYTPRLVTGSASVGIGTTVPVAGVPMTLTLGVGAKAGGSVSPTGGNTLPVLGPTVGLRAQAPVTERVEVYVGADYFHNFLAKAMEERNVTSVPSASIGTMFHF